MNYTFITLGILITALIINIVISNIQKRAFLKGYKQAEFDLTANMLDVATWFGGRKQIYNSLYLFAVRYRNKNHVSAHYFREDILKLGENRITDLPNDEYKQLVE